MQPFRVHAGIVAPLDRANVDTDAITAYSLDGKEFHADVSGLMGRCIQHETDHLDGVLFFDRMRTFESLTFLDEYSRYQVKREDDDEDDD